MRKVNVQQHVMLDCVFTVQKFNASGIVYQGKPFHNLILDVGLDQFAGNSMRNLTRWMNVGDDNTAPAVSQNGLLSHVASTDNTYETNESGQAIDPAHTSRIVTREFAIGSCTGNLTEVGLSVSENDNYFNRQLFRDEAGDPTTITVLSDEGLRVTAELRIYSDLQAGVTETGSFDLNGSPLGYTREVDTNRFADVDCGTYDDCVPARFRGASFVARLREETTLYTGNDGNFDEKTISSYVAGNFYADVEFVWLAGTFVGDAASVALGYDGTGTFEGYLSTFVFDTPITLTDTEQLTLNFRRSWGRYAA